MLPAHPFCAGSAWSVQHMEVGSPKRVRKGGYISCEKNRTFKLGMIGLIVKVAIPSEMIYRG